MSGVVDYAKECVPFIIRDEALNSWPCLQWSASNWAKNCQDIKLTFRVHRKSKFDQVQWEHEAIDYVEATVGQFILHLEGRTDSLIQDKSRNKNPFEAYPPEEYSFYSSYNYMHQLFPSSHELFKSIRWCDTGLCEPKLQNDASNSTFWIGAGGSHTPCHMDTYGYNFVAQLYGRKLWILFPPTDTTNLYPTRIPFEESSIFSQINFQSIDLVKYPLVRQTIPRIVELRAGELLFVPHHWWHYVQNISDTQDALSISVNSWVGDKEPNSDDSLTECLVQFLARPLFDAYGDVTWLNQNASLLTSEEAGRILKYQLTEKKLTAQCKEEETERETNKRAKSLQRHYLDEGTFEDIAHLIKKEDGSIDTEAKFEEKQQLSLSDIINCILDPEVIEVIKRKLKSSIRPE